eukprot:scaffold51731_cov101-Isochrysis_galbana.AAC.2
MRVGRTWTGGIDPHQKRGLARVGPYPRSGIGNALGAAARPDVVEPKVVKGTIVLGECSAMARKALGATLCDLVRHNRPGAAEGEVSRSESCASIVPHRRPRRAAVRSICAACDASTGWVVRRRQRKQGGAGTGSGSWLSGAQHVQRHGQRGPFLLFFLLARAAGLGAGAGAAGERGHGGPRWSPHQPSADLLAMGASAKRQAHKRSTGTITRNAPGSGIATTNPDVAGRAWAANFPTALKNVDARLATSEHARWPKPGAEAFDLSTRFCWRAAGATAGTPVAGLALRAGKRSCGSPRRRPTAEPAATCWVGVGAAGRATGMLCRPLPACAMLRAASGSWLLTEEEAHSSS